MRHKSKRDITYYANLGMSQSLKMDHKVCNKLCDPKVGWKAHNEDMGF